MVDPVIQVAKPLPRGPSHFTVSTVHLHPSSVAGKLLGPVILFAESRAILEPCPTSGLTLVFGDCCAIGDSFSRGSDLLPFGKCPLHIQSDTRMLEWGR